MRFLIIFVSLVTIFSLANSSIRPVQDFAVETAFQSGVPKSSDVLLSSRWFRPMNEDDSNCTMEAVRHFHPTIMAWMYLWRPNTRAGLALLKEQNLTIQAAIATGIHTSQEEAALNAKRDIKGDLIPWRWNTVHLCPNAPGTVEYMLPRAIHLLSLGARSIQVDDWDFWSFAQIQLPHEANPRLENCYCDYCMEGFRRFLQGRDSTYLKTLGVSELETFDYRQYVLDNKLPVNGIESELQKLFDEFGAESVDAFWHDFQKALNEAAGRTVPLSANNFAGIWQPISGPFAFGMSEIPHTIITPEFIYTRLRENAALGKGQVFTTLSRNAEQTRRFIATTTASGGNMIVPWDLFMGPDRPRYFGRPDNYSDLFAFIRAIPEYLDGFEDAAVAWHRLTDERYEERNPVTLPEGSEVFAVTRVNLAEKGGAAVIHLVDWSNNPQPFRIKLDVNRFTDKGDLDIELLIPAEYDEQLHQRAWSSRDYSEMVSRIRPKAVLISHTIQVEVPRLSPWAVLVISEK